MRFRDLIKRVEELSTGGSSAVESFHEIGAAGEPGYLNNWIVNTFGIQTGFYKDRERSYLSGRVVLLAADNPAGPDQIPIFKLPAGYVPPFQINVGCLVMNSVGLLYSAVAQITGEDSGDPYAGEVQITNSNDAGGNDFIVFLDGIDFRIA